MTKETLINNIIYDMQNTLGNTQLQILEKTLQKNLFAVDINERETGLATTDDSNDYCIKIMLFKMKKRLSDKTVKQYERTIRKFTTFCNKPLNQVTSMDVEMFLTMQERGIMKNNISSTLNNTRRYLSSCFLWMRKSGLLSINPCENVEPFPEVTKPIDHLDGIELEMLRDYCDDLRERALVEFLLSTGCRRGEAASVKIRDMDLEREKNCLVYGSKSRQFRYVFLNDAARYHIKKYLDSRTDQCEYLFVNAKGKEKHGVRGDALYSILCSIRKRAEMQRRLYPHLLRKTCATNMRSNGASTDDIGLILGHTPRGTTARFYAAQSNDRLADIHRRCSSF